MNNGGQKNNYAGKGKCDINEHGCDYRFQLSFRNVETYQQIQFSFFYIFKLDNFGS